MELASDSVARGGSRAVTLIEVAILLLAVAIGLTLRSGWQLAVIESGSMEPGLRANDRALIDKRRATIGALKRGDVIIFRWNSNDGAETYVKRIVGLPGDQVIIRRGTLSIDGAPLAEPYLKESGQRERPVSAVVGAEEFFVLGDNRNRSEDSRERGCVRRRNVIGRITRVVWPRSRAGAVK